MKMKQPLTSDLIQLLDPVRFARAALQFEPDQWQADALRTAAKKLILNCCRQSGKSTVAAILATHRILFIPGSLVLLISPSQRQSGELFKKALDQLNKLPDQPRRVEDNKLSITLDSGSRLVSLPGSESTIRGFSGPNLVIFDEAARVPDELYFAVRPMLAVSGGQLILLSTPAGKRGFFFREWSEGEAQKVLTTAESCPRITPAFLAEEYKTLGDFWFKQEYSCEFVESVDHIFTFGQVSQAIDDRLAAWTF
jgi:hypothetical protein